MIISSKLLFLSCTTLISWIFRLNLELYTAGNVMSTDVITLDEREYVRKIAQLLLDTTHSGFPVVAISNGKKVFVGTIAR